MSLRTSLEIDAPNAVVSLSADAAGTYVVPDSALLFQGIFERAGSDLVILNEGAATLRIPGYFLTDPPADIYDANGAVVRGDLVVRMAGPLAPGQYAEAGVAVGASPIGQVETVDGRAIVQRVDGTIEELQVGMKVFQQDVLQTEEGASLSVTFVDGTIFTLASASRMVIDELIFDPNANDNSGGFSLIQGSFVFIAGQVAKTGGMEVSTPSSTMGIRGTTVVVQVASENGIVTSEITLAQDPDGDIGRVELRDNDGNLIANITETDTKWVVSAIDGGTRELVRDTQDNLEDSVLIAEAFAAFRAATSRVDAGDTFVTLSDPTAPGQNIENDTSDGIDFDVDSLDEPEAIDPLDNIEDVPEGEEFVPFDEGFNQQLQGTVEAPLLVTEQGFEDAAITGTAAPTGAAEAGITFGLGQPPENGQAMVNSDGSFAFVPAPDFNGTDSFTYTVSDEGGQIAQGTVVVEVLPVNDAPVASDASATMIEDSSISGAVDVVDLDGDTLTFSIAALPSAGEVLLLPSGSYSYTPNANFEGTDSFGVLASDPEGESSLSTITITVEGENDQPVITSEASAATDAVTEGVEDNTASGQLLAVDPDAGDTVTWSGTSAAAFGTFTLSPDGAWSYALDNATADLLTVGETVTEQFFAVAEDTNGASTPITIEVTVTGTNDAPIATSSKFFDTVEETNLVGALSAIDLDGADTSLSFAASGAGPANGAVTISPDGSFVYAPVAGFVGVDSFEYTITDADGGQSIAEIKVAVESDPDSEANKNVFVDYNVEATPDTAAGAVEIGFLNVESSAVNLAIALDRSGSIQSGPWADMVASVKSALVTLGEQFEGSDTSVDIRIITYATNVTSTDTFDLQDPDLLLAVDGLIDDFTGGQTAWNLAFQEAADFFFGEPSSEPNFLLFVTDGLPSSGAWVTPYGELVDPTDDFDVTIDAFGFGAFYSDGSLDGVDPDAVFLDDPTLLAQAFETTPIFNPSLLGFQITLAADAAAAVVIADETSPGLIIEGTDFELPLASIENIATLLGEENQINIMALFDVDADPSDAEIQLFTSEVIGKAATAQTALGQAQADLLFGSDADDTLGGAGGDDVILGYGGDDTLTGGSGADTLLAGSGDDTIILINAPDEGDLIDGGAGRDTLEIVAVGEINELLAELSISNLEVLDIDNGTSEALVLGFDEIADIFADEEGELDAVLDAALPEIRTISGNDGDTLTLDGTGGYSISLQGTADLGGGESVDIYAFTLGGGNPLATLAVDSDIEVTTANAVAG